MLLCQHNNISDSILQHESTCLIIIIGTHLVGDVVTALQQQECHSVCPQQEVNHLIQQCGGLDESDSSTEDGGRDQDYLLTSEPEKKKKTPVHQTVQHLYHICSV